MASVAQAVRHLYMTDDFGTINCLLLPVGGDNTICYSDFTSTADGNYTPQITESSPRILRLHLTSSLGIPMKVASAEWRFNDALCSGQPTYFESQILNNGATCQLKIKGNVGKLTANTNLLIECVAQVGSDGSLNTTKVEAKCPIYLRQQTSETYRCAIAPLDPDCNFTIVDDNTPVSLKCIVYDWLGNEITDSALTYTWAKRTNQNGTLVWTPLQGNGANLDVFGGDVDSQVQIRVVVSLKGSTIAENTQVVYDNHDPYYIDVRPTPEDERVRKGNPQRQSIAYVIAIKRLSDDAYADSASVTFILTDSYNNQIQTSNPSRQWQNLQWRKNPSGNGQYGPNSTIFTVTADDFINAGREIIMSIHAEMN